MLLCNSLSELVRWLGAKAEELGVEIYPGFAASEVWTSKTHNAGILVFQSKLAIDWVPSLGRGCVLCFINCREPQCYKLHGKYIEENPILQCAFGWPLNEPQAQTRVQEDTIHCGLLYRYLSYGFCIGRM